jgi:Flp pilus assembly protein TadG
MKRRTTMQRGHRRRGERGQTIVLFALALVVMVAMAGLLIDGGRVWSNRRLTQAAADTAALAAAKAIVDGGSGATAALNVATANGFTAGTDCQGNVIPNNGVTVNRPPASGLHAGDNDYVEVITTHKMTTTFASAVGQGCWMVTARAVSSIGTSSVARCSFCSLNKTGDGHTLVLKNGATLRVDGDIYVNSTNGGTLPTDCDEDKELKAFKVCGDAFDVFGAGGQITARTISVAGGWETHDGNPTKADALATMSDGSPCPVHPDPPSQVAPWLPSNVCIHMPQIADPLNDPAAPGNIVAVPPVTSPPVAGTNGCPVSALTPTGTALSPAKLTIATNATICPGMYYGGISITAGTTTMMPGTYYMAGGGFSVTDTGAVDGSSGVLIYNSSGTVVEADSTPGVDLVPAKDKSKLDPKGVQLTAVPNPPAVSQNTVLTMNVDPDTKNGGGLPTGVMTFFEGSTPITGCSNLPAAEIPVGGGHVKASCTTSWNTFGTKALSAVYYGDATYNAVGKTLNLNIAAPAGSLIAPITMSTTGAVKLSGATSGSYKGLTIFQDRSSALTITINPGPGGAPACSGSWLTQDVPDTPGVDPPPACGALGGLQGTIYAPNDAALVYITASGLANLQVISGKLQIDSDADARFAYTPQYFANGSIRLVE